MRTERTAADTSMRARARRAVAVGCLLCLGLTATQLSGCHQQAHPGNQLPPAIADIEEGAEDIFDLANAAQWNRAVPRINLLRETTARLEASQGRQLPELERAIAELDRAVETRDLPRSRRSANEVMRQAVLLGSPQLEKDAARILMLDVETREVLIDVDDDPQAANAAVARIADLWQGLRPAVEKRGDHDLATRCDGHLRVLQAGSPTIRRAEAEAFLEAIDRLEDLFS